jgi:hypothetical protein
VLLDTLTSEQKLDILQLELGDVCSIKFTPGEVGDPIDRLAEVISIEHSIAPTEHSVRFGFSTLDFTSLVLDDTVFGRLDAGNALAF